MASAPPSTRKARKAAERAARRQSLGPVRKRRAPIVLAALLLMLIALLALGVMAVRSALTNPVERGREALAEGDYRSARVDFTAVLAEYPNDTAVRIDLARALNGLERGVEAERQLMRARELGASAQAVRVSLARALLIQARPADALAALDGPIPLAEREAAMVVAGEGNYRLGRLDAARRAFASAVEAGSAESFIAMARYRLAEQDMLGADAAADAAWRRAPRSVEALAVKADVVLTRGGPVAALPWYEAALERGSNHVPTLLSYAAALGEAGRAQAMLAPLRRAAELEPNNPRGLYLMAALAARGNEPALARTLLGRIRGVEAERPAVLLLRAASELMLDAPVAARNAAARLLELQPDNRAARRLLALALSKEDNIRGAIEVIDPITIRADADSWSLLLLSRSFSGLGWHGDAAQPLDRAASLIRGDPPPLGAGGDAGDSLDPAMAVPTIRARLAQGLARDALALAERLAAANPGVPQARLLVGDAALMTGDVSGAARHYHAASELRFDESTMLRLVSALARSGDAAGASEALNAYMARWPENVAAMRVAATMAGERGDWAAALAALEPAMARAGPNDALLLSQIARARIELGDANDAIAPAARAYRLLPGNATVSGVYGRALALSGEGDGRDAADLLLKAVRLAPEDAVLQGWFRALRA
jgi:cellulose synthase operon protein C